MTLTTKSAAIGIGGTLAYYALWYTAMRGMDGADWTVPMGRYQVLNFIGEALMIPLIPGALPGLIVAGVLARLGLIGGGFHDGDGLLEERYPRQWFTPLSFTHGSNVRRDARLHQNQGRRTPADERRSANMEITHLSRNLF